jgi:large subunit ribosomal protein L4
MSLQIPALSGDKAGGVNVSETIFGQAYNETLVHQLVVKFLAGARAGTKAQKTRSEVSGGGAKPWRQKGTGRARSGTTRGPIWRTGGVAFAAKPRNYEQKLNKKMFRVGIRSILSELLRQNRIMISDSILPDSPKTKALADKLKNIGANRILFVVDQVDKNLALASRNIPSVEVVEVANLSPVLLITADKIIATSSAIQKIEGAYA